MDTTISVKVKYSTDTLPKKQPQTIPKTEIHFFKWSYINSYDDNVGTASVKLVKIYKPAGVAFEITIVPDNLDVLEYKGYMDGSLKELN